MDNLVNLDYKYFGRVRTRKLQLLLELHGINTYIQPLVLQARLRRLSKPLSSSRDAPGRSIKN